MINPDDWDEEELRLIRDTLKYAAYILALLLVFGILFTGCMGCGLVGALIAA